MTLPRLVIRKARKDSPVLPTAFLRHGEPTDVLLFKCVNRKVVETQILTAHPELTDLSISGFTHYAVLPKYIYP